MKKFVILFVLFFYSLYSASAQEKRALLIGINQYMPPKGYKSPMPSFRSAFKNLSGPVNDVRAFYSVLTSRFYFPAKSIDTLINKAATRSAILRQMSALLNSCNKGDIAFIMYAGHGSRVINTLSTEVDKKDESIVPADTYIPGVQDIRDKELAAIFNKFVDKGIKLTVFFDCCHSGSLARGPFDGTVSRFMPDAGYDAKDASNPIPPETRSEGTFLFISSSQNDEPAREKPFEAGVMYGGFSYSFIKAIEQQSVNAPVLNLFTAARAILKSNALIQEPVIAGSTERLQQTFLGYDKGVLEDKVLVPVIDVDEKQVVLQGGFAIGLYPENELAKLNGNDTIAILRIEKILGVNKSLATIIKGSIKNIAPGDLFAVTNWVNNQAPLLKIYISTASFQYDQVVKFAAINNELKNMADVKWVNSLARNDPYTTIFYEGNSVKINVNGKELPAPKLFSASSIKQLTKPDSSFYFELPSPAMLNDLFRIKLLNNKSISVVKNLSEAQYMILGTINEQGQPAYGLRKVQTASKDSLESMPVQTTVFPLLSAEKKVVSEIVDSLFDKAMKLSKIKGWLNLAPPVEGLAKFPYHIEMVNRLSNTIYQQPEVKVGDKIDYYLVFDSAFDVNSLSRKFVYVFVIDSDGKMQLAYPRGVDGNQINQFPKKDNKGVIVIREKIFGGTIGEPAGTDNYFLLATDEAIPNHMSIFSQAGVRAAPINKTPLANLLNMGNEGGTRNLNKTISNWTVIKLQVKSSK